MSGYEEEGQDAYASVLDSRYMHDSLLMTMLVRSLKSPTTITGFVALSRTQIDLHAL